MTSPRKPLAQAIIDWFIGLGNSIFRNWNQESPLWYGPRQGSRTRWVSSLILPTFLGPHWKQFHSASFKCTQWKLSAIRPQWYILGSYSQNYKPPNGRPASTDWIVQRSVQGGYQNHYESAKATPWQSHSFDPSKFCPNRQITKNTIII